jgi:hypothetical protein
MTRIMCNKYKMQSANMDYGKWLNDDDIDAEGKTLQIFIEDQILWNFEWPSSNICEASHVMHTRVTLND